MDCQIKENYEKIWKVFFLLIIALPALFINKYVYNFRINQEVVINIFIFAVFIFYILNTINEGKFIHSTHSLNLPILLFILSATLSILLNNIL